LPSRSCTRTVSVTVVCGPRGRCTCASPTRDIIVPPKSGGC
jgi:hypothetical protein